MNKTDHRICTGIGIIALLILGVLLVSSFIEYKTVPTERETILNTHVLMPTIEELQQLCVKHGEDVVIDNKMGPETLEAMERVRCNQEAEIAIRKMERK